MALGLHARELNAPIDFFRVLLPVVAVLLLQISKKRKFVNDGVFQAELNEFLSRTLAEDGYSGVEVRVTPIRTEIIIRATRTREVLGEKGRRIRELTSLVQKRFGFPPDSVELFAERVENRGLCAMAQAESLRYKLLKGLAVRRACYGVLRHIMESGAKGPPAGFCCCSCCCSCCCALLLPFRCETRILCLSCC